MQEHCGCLPLQLVRPIRRRHRSGIGMQILRHVHAVQGLGLTEKGPATMIETLFIAKMLVCNARRFTVPPWQRLLTCWRGAGCVAFDDLVPIQTKGRDSGESRAVRRRGPSSPIQLTNATCCLPIAGSLSSSPLYLASISVCMPYLPCEGFRRFS